MSEYKEGRGDYYRNEGIREDRAALSAEAVGWARQLMAQGYVDEHIVEFTETGYGLQHPIRCRPNLIGCIFNEWLATQMAPDRDPGRYVMTWADPEKDDGPTYRPDPAPEEKPR